MTAVKICGLKDSENLRTAIDAGADFIGLVFYPPSPRFIDFHTAANLRQLTPAPVKAVGLFVDPSDEDLEKFANNLRLDMIQLHGAETPERVQQIKERFQKPIIKALAIESAKDLQQIEEFQEISDWILLDSKTTLHGGSGKSFDWEILKNTSFKKPWMLSGGLTAENIKTALAILKPDAVDVSSGVERERGIKDAAKIRNFITAVRA